MRLSVSNTRKRLMVVPKKRETRQISAPTQHDQEQSQRATNATKRSPGGPANTRFQDSLRETEKGIRDRRTENYESNTQQPVVYSFVEGKGKEIEAKCLSEQRID